MRIIPTLFERQLDDAYYIAATLAVQGGLSRAKLTQALGRIGSGKDLYEADEAILRGLGLFTAKQIDCHLEKHHSGYPFQLKRQCEELGVRLLTFFDEEYPAGLKQIADPPLVLYVMGEMPKERYAVAVVGSRECTDYGLEATHYFSAGLARHGIPIISGGARGIDTEAHKACLRAGGRTVAVLGCGLDIAYPEENRSLFQRIAKQGAVVSEYAPGVKPFAYNFPARNRIIVGLSQAVLVAEAASKSGAIITAHLAADEGREVYAVPGSIFSGRSVGCHDLLRKGAKPVDVLEDVLEDRDAWQTMMSLKHGNEGNLFDFQISEEERLAFEKQQAEVRKRSAAEARAKQRQAEEAKKRQLAALTATAQKVYACLDDECIGFDALIEKSGEDFMTVSMAVLDLQVAGLIVEEGLQQYHRV